MQLFIVRHAQIAYLDAAGQPLDAVEANPSLTALGRRQAEALADRLGRVGLSALYCAPALRCVETAQAICAAAGVTGAIVPWLGEIGRFWEDWRRRPVGGAAALRCDPDPVATDWPEVADESGDLPAGRLGAARARCRRALDLLLRAHRREADDRVCLCTHSQLAIFGLAPVLAGTPPAENHRFLLDHAALTHVQCDGRGNLFRRVNCSRHLADLTAAICSNPACAATARHPEERACRACGAPLLRECPTCRTSIPAPAPADCPHCGNPYRPAATG